MQGYGDAVEEKVPLEHLLAMEFQTLRNGDVISQGEMISQRLCDFPVGFWVGERGPRLPGL